MGERSISVGRDASGSAFVTGDQSTATTTYQVRLPSPESVDIRTEVAALKGLLAQLASPDRDKLERALADAEEEAGKSEPDRDELGNALERAITYAKRANGFADQVAKLKPHLEAACAWLGRNWHNLLAAAGVAV